MICEQVKTKTGEYVDGVMDDISHKAFEAHLVECIACKSFFEETINAIAWVKQANDVQPPQHLRQSVLKILQVEQQAKQHRRFKPQFMQAIAAAAVFLLLIAGNILPLQRTINNFTAPEREITLMEANDPENPPAYAVPAQETVTEDSAKIMSTDNNTTDLNLTETEPLLPGGTKNAFPYRLALNIIGVPILIALILIVIKNEGKRCREQ